MQIVENTTDRVVIVHRTRLMGIFTFAFLLCWTAGVGLFFLALLEGGLAAISPWLDVGTLPGDAWKPLLMLAASAAMFALGLFLTVSCLRELLSRTERSLAFDLSAGTLILHESGLRHRTQRQFPLANVALGILIPTGDGDPDQCLSVTVPPERPGAPRQELWAKSTWGLPALSRKQEEALRPLLSRLRPEAALRTA